MKRMLSMLAIVLLVACIAGAGCTGEDGATDTAPGEVEITAENNGDTIEVAEGGSITISLEENPTTGYEWNATVSEGLEIVSDTYLPSDTSGQVAGSGGIREWKITAAEAGTQSFAAVYKRPWENTTGTEDTFEVTFTVL